MARQPSPILPMEEPKRSKGPLVALLGAVAAAGLLVSIPEDEGTRYTAYRDVVGIWTICHGDTLGGEVYSVWRTLAHVIGCWDVRLARDHRPLSAPAQAPPRTQAAPTTDASVPGVPPPLHRTPRTNPPNSQLTLF